MTVFIARLEEKGGLSFGSVYNRARWVDFCNQNKGKFVRVELPQSKRTLAQNSFYWVYLTVIARETGNSEDDLHEFFKEKFLPRKVAKIRGKEHTHEFKKQTSTTHLTKLEMGEYMDKICEFTGVPIPSPEEAGYFK